MHLSQVTLTNFRGTPYLCVTFHKGVNVLIGENRSCKTAVLDALRLCFGLSVERRDIYIQPEDFYTAPDGTQASTIDLDLVFVELTPEQKGLFVELLTIRDDGTTAIQLHVRYTQQGDRIRRSVWGGPHEGQEVPAITLELFYHTYLGALRDATRDLAPSRANRLSQLFLKLTPDSNERNALAKTVNSQIHAIPSWKELVERAKTKIEEHLQEVVLSGDDTRVAVEFVDATFREIVEGLRIRIPRGIPPQAGTGDPGTQQGGSPPPINDSAVPTETNTNTAPGTDAPALSAASHFSIAQNSLGYNNLLYIATVLGDIVERHHRSPQAFAALLIEEPEAHLHPHWQNTLFQYLQGLKDRGVQVFISSHSPTITAKSDIDSLVTLCRSGEAVTATPLRRLPLDSDNKKHLQRFLDVTKSQLFFSRSVILVEGISEALLLPTFATIMGAQFNLDKHGVEIVNIDGVAFEPFALLFNNASVGLRLPIRCALLTDDDRSASGTRSARAECAEKLRGGNLEVFMAAVTFEHELYIANEALLLREYQLLHKRTDLAFEGGSHERATAFVDKLKSNQDKAVFAQHLAQKLQDATTAASFIVPDYIQRTIRWTITGNANTDRTAA